MNILEDPSKCIVANKYKSQIIRTLPIKFMTEIERENVLPSTRRESRPRPQFFKTEIMNFGNGIEITDEESATHVPLIIPIFTPRNLINTNKSRNTFELHPGKSEEAKERPNLFEEFLIIGADRKNLKKGLFHPVNLFQYPNLPIHCNWYATLTL